jgi:Secretion system C-terminal sorting domain/Kelch motif
MKPKQLTTFAFTLVCTFVHAQTWSSARLTEARGDCAVGVIGKKLIVAGGGTNYISLTVGKSSRIDIYDDSTNLWTTATLSSARFNPYSAIIGKKMYILGGQEGDSNNPSNKYDVYDTETNSVTVRDTLPFKPFNSCVATANNKILFAGGLDANYQATPIVQIWDVPTNTWSQDTLSETRTHIQSIVMGSKIFFVGGLTSTGLSDAIDIYDTDTRRWTRKTLSNPRMYPMLAVVGNKLVMLGGVERFGSFGGFSAAFFSKWIDIYDANTNTWSFAVLYEARGGHGGVTWGDRAYFILGSSSNDTRPFDYGKINVYNATANTWSDFTPPSLLARTAQSVAMNHKIFIIGGTANKIPSNQVDIMTFATNTAETHLLKMELATFPNPVVDQVQLKFKSEGRSDSQISITDAKGQIVKIQDYSMVPEQNIVRIDCKDLPNGVYWVTVQSNQVMGSSLFVKND